jgi:hypothetical protein
LSSKSWTFTRSTNEVVELADAQASEVRPCDGRVGFGDVRLWQPARGRPKTKTTTKLIQYRSHQAIGTLRARPELPQQKARQWWARRKRSASATQG